jgi:hypothetical protein
MLAHVKQLWHRKTGFGSLTPADSTPVTYLIDMNDPEGSRVGSTDCLTYHAHTHADTLNVYSVSFSSQATLYSESGDVDQLKIIWARGADIDIDERRNHPLYSQSLYFHSLQLLPNIRTIIVENAHCNPAVFNESGLADYIETAPQPLSIQFERCADTLVSFARSFSRLSERKVLWNNEELQHK